MSIIKNIIQAVIMIMLTAAVLVPSRASAQFFFMENEDVGKAVKDFTLKTVNGGETSLEKYRDGKNTIVFFWATWCPHCRVELKKLSDGKEDIEKKNIKIALVDIGEKEDVVARYLTKNKIAYDVFLDIDSVVSEEYGLIGVPTFYFVGEDGLVKDVQHSLPEKLEEVFLKSSDSAAKQ